MNITNLPKANEIYNQVRDCQGKLEHMKTNHKHLVLKLEMEKPNSGNGVNKETIIIHEFKKDDATFDHVMMDLYEHYTNKIKELKEEFKEL